MQAGKGQALVERILDLDLVAPFIAMPADMQRLVDVGNQVEQPGQGVADLLGLATGSQLPDQELDPVVQFAFAHLAKRVEIDIVPTLVAGGIGQAGKGWCRRLAVFIEETWIVADVVRPGGGLGKQVDGLGRAGLVEPAAVVWVAGKMGRDGFARGR